MPVIDKLVAWSQAQHAEIVLVDFAASFGWREHGDLWNRIRESGITVALDPVEIVIDGQFFSPIAHFRDWREREARRRASKPDRKTQLLGLMMRMQASGNTHAAIAAELNALGETTLHGKAWTADNVRKFMKG